MTRALLLVTVAAGAAHAQAPGQQPPAPPPSVMSQRWAIGLALGSESLTPHVAGGSQSAFGVLEASVRFRWKPAFELALALDGGGAKSPDLGLGSIFIGARYRFLPGEPWNGYVLGGLGVASVAGSHTSGAETKGRGSLRLGGGVERRFGHVAIELELHLIAIAHNKDVPDPIVPTAEAVMARYGLTGASLALGVTYYF